MPWRHGRATLHVADCVTWLEERAANSIHGCVTDPPYGLREYSPREQAKLRRGRGGVWRQPPALGGKRRAPLPRFTTLTAADVAALDAFFETWGRLLLAALVPGGHAVIASNPLVAHHVTSAICSAGFERRGEIVRLVRTLRGGDRPKNAEDEFSGVSVLPRSMHEPWLLFRKPLDGRVQDNLCRWKTGGLRRPSAARPFGDVIASAPAGRAERRVAPHPSLKPQAFLRQVVRAVLPLGEGVVLDPFAGSGSTLAAAEAVGYESIGIERDEKYAAAAREAIGALATLAEGEDK